MELSTVTMWAVVVNLIFRVFAICGETPIINI